MAGDVIYYKYIDKTGNMIIAVKGGTPSVYANFSDGVALMIDAESKYFLLIKQDHLFQQIGMNLQNSFPMDLRLFVMKGNVDI